MLKREYLIRLRQNEECSATALAIHHPQSSFRPPKIVKCIEILAVSRTRLSGNLNLSGHMAARYLNQLPANQTRHCAGLRDGHDHVPADRHALA
jgi:hypothetical protein